MLFFLEALSQSPSDRCRAQSGTSKESVHLIVLQPWQEQNVLTWRKHWCERPSALPLYICQDVAQQDNDLNKSVTPRLHQQLRKQSHSSGAVFKFTYRPSPSICLKILRKQLVQMFNVPFVWSLELWALVLVMKNQLICSNTCVQVQESFQVFSHMNFLEVCMKSIWIFRSPIRCCDSYFQPLSTFTT